MKKNLCTRRRTFIVGKCGLSGSLFLLIFAITPVLPNPVTAQAPYANDNPVLQGQLQAAKNELFLVKSALQIQGTAARQKQRLQSRQLELERLIAGLEAQLSATNR